MKERKVYYKVVCPGTGSEGDFMSVFTTYPCLHYRVGEYTSTVKALADLGFHPTIFKDKASAMEFVHTMMCGRIFECHIIGLIKNPPLRFTCGASPLHFMRRTEKSLGRPFRAPTPTHGGSEWPVGTMMAKKVKLLRRV